ncbi:MAG TPA: DNA-processing protein DprA, partial [Candidatus Competibacteraceae bacterium]|nr:DNA-processing protein DprA [Candidatus Competibacteraceae bacterium]
MNSTESSYRLALLRAPGIGPVRFARLLERFGSAAAVFAANRSDWSAVGLSETTLDYLKAPAWQIVEQDLRWLEQPGNHLLGLDDPRYPPLLRRIAQAPPLLFVHGNPLCLCERQLAIVGTRNPTPAGRETTRHFASHLAGAGLGITSGLALGVDAEAHRGALLGQGFTIAVMGTGPDRIYPSAHRDLAHAIAERGALVSELPLGTLALAEHFPCRNRIISGLTLGTLVVEASLHSGSLITARLAVEQGREVFAIPGSIHNTMAKGCHSLIRQGAKLVETATDILEELGPLAVAAATAAVPPAPPVLPPELDDDYRSLLEQLGQEPVSVDGLVERCGLTAEAVSSML